MFVVSDYIERVKKNLLLVSVCRAVWDPSTDFVQMQTHDAYHQALGLQPPPLRRKLLLIDELGQKGVYSHDVPIT